MKRKDLLSAIKSVMAGVDKATKTVGMDFIVFDNGWIRSFKDAISVSYPMETGFVAAVKAEEFFKILSKMSGEDVTIEAGENKLIATDGKTTLKMNTLQEDQLTQVMERITTLQTDELEWYEIPPNLITGLNLCIFSAGVDPALNLLAGVHFMEDKILSTDNYRMSVFNMEGAVISPFTVPTKVAEGFLKINTKFTSIAVTNSWVHLADEVGAVFSARLISGTYPSDKVLDLLNSQISDQKGYVLPEGIEKCLDRAEVMAGVEEGVLSLMANVSLSYEGEKLIIKANREVGELIDTIPWTKDPMPEGMELKMAPSFLKKILPITRTFNPSSSKKSVMFSSNNFYHVMIAKMM